MSFIFSKSILKSPAMMQLFLKVWISAENS